VQAIRFDAGLAAEVAMLVSILVAESILETRVERAPEADEEGAARGSMAALTSFEPHSTSKW
jgi:hypothetical protein